MGCPGTLGLYGTISSSRGPSGGCCSGYFGKVSGM